MIPANLCFNHGTRQGTKSERKICGIPAKFAGIYFLEFSAGFLGLNFDFVPWDMEPNFKIGPGHSNRLFVRNFIRSRNARSFSGPFSRIH